MKDIFSFITALVAGVLFGVGLIISQMVNPDKVKNFLDITGEWDPSLAFVMISALVIFIPAYWMIAKLNKPILVESFNLPTKKKLDKPLIVGAILFGIGWGISGICPGPAVVNITGDTAKIMVFIIAMLIGMLISGQLRKSFDK